MYGEFVSANKEHRKMKFPVIYLRTAWRQNTSHLWKQMALTNLPSKKWNKTSVYSISKQSHILRQAVHSILALATF